MQPKFEGALYQIEKALKANCMPTVSAFSHKSNCAYFTVQFNIQNHIFIESLRFEKTTGFTFYGFL